VLDLPTLVRRNGWGEFVFGGYRLGSAQGASNRIGILIEQLVYARLEINSHQQLVARLSADRLVAVG
jgi:hypothetical protein